MKVRHVDWYSDEWLAGTYELGNAERGLYVTACSLIYSTGGPITRARLRAACRDHGHAFNRQLDALIAAGKLDETEGQISNKRCVKELQRAEERRTKAQQTAAKRWSKDSENSDLGKSLALQPAMLTNQLPTNQLEEEEKSSLTGAKKEVRGTRLATDFEVPAEWIAAGAEARVKANLPPVDLATEALKFVNHFVGASGQNTIKKDWRRTWINWALNAKARNGSQRSAADNLIEGFGRAAGIGGPGDSEPDWQAANPLLDGKHAGFDA